MITALMTNTLRRPIRILTFSFAFCALLVQPQCRAQSAGWPAYGGDPGGTRFSPASQINKSNVTQLKVAWTFHTAALPHDPNNLDKKATFEATPILIDGNLFFTTPFDHVFAINAETGAKLWEFDPQLELPYGASEVTSRGVSAWHDPKAKPGQPCALRIFFGTLDARLFSIDGATGKRCADFADNGEIDLGNGIKLRDPGEYQVTSAPAVVGDVVVTGSSIGDNRAVTLERGIVRAFDVRTGKLRWSWDPIPWALTTTPRTGAGNAWSTISADPERNLIFIPTGSASPDYYGGVRKGDNKWANSVVALKASTGEFVWGFQVVHHDIWDYDVASQPTLFTWKDKTPAIAITTKMGRVFVLNRLTGAPLIPVEEVPVPKSDIPGEESWPTQPSGISVVPETLSVDDAWGITPELKQWCADKIKSARAGSIFLPPSVQGTLVYPSNVGGVNWGSSAYDPANHLLIMNTNRLPILVRMIPRDELDVARKGATDLDRLHGEFARQTGAPFAMFRTPLLSAGGLPCNAPPWGTVAAVDLFTGKKAWDVPLGSYLPQQKTGTINLGGVIVTAGGLVFSAAGMDSKLHAFDSTTGAELWSVDLPAGGQATPMTYTINGKQYLVLAAGGHGKLGTKQGDSVLAFTLP
ncbi:MAG TPA: pyrroloquinoline quinone-dependent dehydrogenase [Candidatus Acidoferrum sp.]|nr:pyrroloquinoline quinone-dependent dehydrogenase [Candidatus Acidoferrum sp.]